MGRCGRPRSPLSGTDSAGPGRTSDVVIPYSGRSTTTARSAPAQAQVLTVLGLSGRATKLSVQGEGAQDKPGVLRVWPPAAREQGEDAASGVGSATLTIGSAGLSVQ